MTYFELVQERDLQQIGSIIQEAYKPIAAALSRPPGALDSTVDKLIYAFKNDQLYGIYYDEKKLIGTFSLILTERKTAKLFHFAIKPRYQNQGIGSQVITKVIKIIRKKEPSITEIELEIYLKIPSLIRFYKNFGFTQIGEKHIRGEEILIFSKKL